VCTLLTPAEVTRVIDANDGGKPSGGPDGGTCTWENPQTYHSITVGIGESGTAANGALPPDEPGFETEPGPDGMRFHPGGMALFVVGNRACDVNVVAGGTDDQQRAAEVELAKLIRGRA
jgi:hypothetical protein